MESFDHPQAEKTVSPWMPDDNEITYVFDENEVKIVSSDRDNVKIYVNNERVY